MDQDPITQGGSTPTPGGQPTNINTTNTTPTATGDPSAVQAESITTSVQNPVASDPIMAAGQNPVVVGATIQTTAPDGRVTTTEMVPKKKKRAGLVALIITLVIVLLAAGGLAFWYFVIRSNPERIAYDAITGFLQEKNLQIDGSFHAPILEDGEAVANVFIDIDSSTDHTTGESKVKFSLIPTALGIANAPELDESFEGFTIELGNAFMSDGVIYFRLDHLMETIDTYLDIMEIDLAETDGFAPMAYSLAETIDGEWWQISVPDIIDWLANIGGAEDQARPVKDFYACMIKTIQTDMTGELVKLYDQHRFVRITETATIGDGQLAQAPLDGHSFYVVDFDYDQLASFVNALPSSTIAESGYQCINTLIDAQGGSSSNHVSASDFEETTADEYRDWVAEDVDLYLEISDRDHNLYGVIIEGKGDYAGQSASLVFTHNPVTVTAPTSYRPITDLIDQAMEMMFYGIFGDIYNEVVGREEGYYDPETGEWISTGGFYYDDDLEDWPTDDDWSDYFDDLSDI